MASERDRLVEEHIGLVRSIATSIARGLPSQVPLEDLVPGSNTVTMTAPNAPPLASIGALDLTLDE